MSDVVQQLRRRLGPGTFGIMAALLGAWVAQQLLLLMGQSAFIQELYLQPYAVFRQGKVWQPFTYVWLHSPMSPFHLLMNGLFLFWFGPDLERLWGTRASFAPTASSPPAAPR
jgi:membrane associated rhomboid family serine protease